MGLTELPSELLKMILVEAVQLRGIKRALRLRLVSSMYSTTQ